MAYLLKIVIFHGYMSHNQMVTGKMVDLWGCNGHGGYGGMQVDISRHIFKNMSNPD